MACELAELGAQLVEQRYRRDHPDASDDAVRAQARAWWLDRPGAPDGDAVGRHATWTLAGDRALTITASGCATSNLSIDDSSSSGIWRCRSEPSRA